MKIVAHSYGKILKGGKIEDAEMATIRLTRSDWIRIGQEAGWPSQVNDQLSKEQTGFYCPDCGRKGDMLNASMPMIYTCPLCEITWNPDNLPQYAKSFRGDIPSLRRIFKTQSPTLAEEGAETTLEDFIYKAHKAGYGKERIVQGLQEFYRQHPSSGEGIYDRAMAKLQNKGVK